jgi:hypothetical protein
MKDEPTIRLRPTKHQRRQPDEAKAWSRAFKGLLHVARMTSSRKRKSAGSGGPAARRTRNPHSQRCAVRLTYSPNRRKGQWRAHGRYIQRESATTIEPNQGSGFTATSDRADVAEQLDRWQTAPDPRLFKIILSPEFGNRLDLRKLIRDFMAQVEADIGWPIEWVAVTHHNTDHPHVHIALRGIAAGQPIRFNRDYIRHALRAHAESLCTRELGFRTIADAIEANRRNERQTGFGNVKPITPSETVAFVQRGKRTSTDGQLVTKTIRPSQPPSTRTR